MEPHEKAMMMASEALLRVGPQIFQRTTKVIGELIGTNLLFDLGEMETRMIAGCAILKFSELAVRYYDENDAADTVLLDRCIILAARESAQESLDTYEATVSRRHKLSACIARWVVCNASLPRDIYPGQPLKMLDPWNWVDTFRASVSERQSKRFPRLHEDGVMLYRELEDGRLCLLHWYAEMIIKQDRQLRAFFPKGIVSAVDTLVTA